jgi:hypothetical protein
MRAPLFIFSFTSSIQVEISAQLPACKDSFPSSLLLNNSFEDYSGCNTMTTIEGGVIDAPTEKVTVTHWHSFTLNTWEPLYFNFNCRNNRPGSAFDTTAFQSDKPCIYSFPRVPLPLPDSNGFIGISETDNVQFSPEDKIAKKLYHALPFPTFICWASIYIKFLLRFWSFGFYTMPPGVSHKISKPLWYRYFW